MRWLTRRLLLLFILLLLLVVCITAALLYKAFLYLRGRRNRDQGIPCIQCERRAFPIAGTAKRYRCWNCGCRFDGPEHF